MQIEHVKRKGVPNRFYFLVDGDVKWGFIEVQAKASPYITPNSQTVNYKL